MKALLKNLGLILVLAGAVLLLICALTGNVNNNGLLITGGILTLVGLISYIVINKNVTD